MTLVGGSLTSQDMRRCAPVILVQRRALSEALGQVWGGQPPAPKHNQVSCAVLDGFVGQRLGEAAGRQERTLHAMRQSRGQSDGPVRVRLTSVMHTVQRTLPSPGMSCTLHSCVYQAWAKSSAALIRLLTLGHEVGHALKKSSGCCLFATNLLRSVRTYRPGLPEREEGLIRGRFHIRVARSPACDYIIKF